MTGKFAPRRLVLAAEAVAALTAATVRVRKVPFARWRPGLELGQGGEIRMADRALAIEIGNVVRAVGRRFPRLFICLPQAMAAQAMLRRRGIASAITFGARRPRSQQVEAAELHAWLHHGEQMLTGQDVGGGFSKLGPGETA